MNFKWGDYLQLANELCSNRSDTLSEAYDRTIISRSYYAVYNAAAKVIEKREGTIDWSSVPNSHQYVINKFLKSEDESEKEIGQQLDMLKKERKRADYRENNKNINRNNATLQYSMAKQAFAAIKAL